MDNVLQEIYKNFIQEKEEDKESCVLKKEVLHLLGDSKSYPDQQIYEKYRDMAFKAAEAGEEAGFYRGFRYAMQLFMECR